MGVTESQATEGQPRSLYNSGHVIKGLAAGLMVIDHVGAVFFPQASLLRYVGRLSFPLFSWLLAQGEQRTRQVYRYGLRLFAFGVITQPIYSALFNPGQLDNLAQLNVLFTLLLGLVTLRLGRRHPQVKYLIWVLGVLVAALIPMDGGGYGVAMILLLSYPITLRWWGPWIALHGVLAASGEVLMMQLWAIPAPLIITLTSTKAQSPAPERDRPSPPAFGRRPKIRWFYWFYPGHLLALWLIRLLLT